MTDAPKNEALEKLNRGIRESRQTVQQQTMKLAQEYFDDSVEELKQQVRDNRATLENLPDQVPGGREESFQMLFQELMSNYSKIEDCLAEAQKNVANLDTERLRRQEEVEASDAARREAQEMGVDLTQIEGTGSGGRIVVDDVRNLAEEVGEKEVNASDAARRKAEELGVDLSRIEGTGSEGQITVNDVNNLSEEMKEQAAGKAKQAVQGAQDVAGQAQQTTDGAVQGVRDTAGGAAGQARDTIGQATGQVQGGVKQVTDQVAQTTRQAQDTTAQAAGQAQGSAEEPKVTSAARRKAEELDVDLSKVKGTGSDGLITIRDVVGS